MDNAFATKPFGSYTVSNLEAFIAEGRDTEGKMAAEVARRAKVKAGDVSVMTPAERLRFAN